MATVIKRGRKPKVVQSEEFVSPDEEDAIEGAAVERVATEIDAAENAAHGSGDDSPENGEKPRVYVRAKARSAALEASASQESPPSKAADRPMEVPGGEASEPPASAASQPQLSSGFPKLPNMPDLYGKPPVLQ